MKHFTVLCRCMWPSERDEDAHLRKWVKDGDREGKKSHWVSEREQELQLNWKNGKHFTWLFDGLSDGLCARSDQYKRSNSWRSLLRNVNGRVNKLLGCIGHQRIESVGSGTSFSCIISSWWDVDKESRGHMWVAVSTHRSPLAPHPLPSVQLTKREKPLHQHKCGCSLR